MSNVVQYEGSYDSELLKNADAAISAAVTAVRGANAAIQVAAVSILVHSVQHGDYTKANTLVELTAGMNRKSLVDWFVQFGGLAVKGGKFSGWKGADYIREHFAEAKKTAWWGVTPDKPWAGFFLEERLSAVFKGGFAAAKKVEEDPSLAEKFDFDVELVRKLQRVMAIHKAEKLMAEEAAAAAARAA